MTTDWWQRVKSLFERTLDQLPAARAAFLAEAGENPSVVAEVRKLIAGDAQAGSFLEDATAVESPAAPLLSPGDLVGGNFRIASLLGRGGMGEVWLAEQKQPVRRRVAIKLIKAGMDTREVVARFESERQALALMDHPNIAKIFDAGATAQGRPYFVMEYVTGIPITEYCDKHKMTLRQRLELFVHVCEGVQHAHQKAIIHRDLKPTNILVGEVDGKPVPRIIDFGLAKATSLALTAETLFTRAGAIMGTPAYMSPEQADPTGVDVDTRTDVYSLGVVLYELLVGAVPLDLHKLAFDEIMRRMREDEAPRPSTKLRTLGEQSGTMAKNRGSALPALARQLRGDLDAIALKAIEKDRKRRYPSASELAADIARYLCDEPVTAGPAGPVYRFRKFGRKHRAAVVALAATIVFLASGFGVTSNLLIRIGRQRTLLQHESYAANLTAAELLLRDHQPDAAEARLLACEPTLRNWEWRHLWHKRDSSLARLNSEGGFDNTSFPSVIGFAGQRTCWNTQNAVECWDGPAYRSPQVFHFPRVLGMSNDAALAVTGGDSVERRSPAGDTLTGGDGVVRVVEVASGKLVAACVDCRVDRDSYYAVFSPDGTRVAMPSAHCILVWNARSGRTIARIPAEKVRAFSPDGSQLALGSPTSGPHAVASLELWNIDPPHKIASMDAGVHVNTAVFSPDGARLASGSLDGAVRVWNLKPLAGPVVLATSGPQVQAVAFSSDGHSIVATGGDRAIRIWINDRLAASLNAFELDSSAVAFSPDGRLVAGTQNTPQLAIWDATTYGGQILGLRHPVEAIAVSPDSKRVVAGLSSGKVELLGMDGAVVGGWLAHHDRIRAVALSGDGRRLITGSDDRTARLWDAASGSPGGELRGHEAAVTAVALSPDGTLVATGSKDGTAMVWDSATGRPVTTIKLKYPVTSVTFSPDSGGLLVSTDRDPLRFPLLEEAPVRLWNSVTGTLLREFRTSVPCAEILGRKLQCPVSQVSFSPDGRRLVASNGTVWDVRNGAVIAELSTAKLTGTAIFSPDGSRIVTSSAVQGVVQIWDAVRYQPLLTMGGEEKIRSLTFSTDGALLLGIGLQGIRMWNTTTSHPPDPAGGHLK